MKRFKLFFSALCAAAVFSMPVYSFSGGDGEGVVLRRASEKCLYEEVEKELGQRISDLEESLKRNISDVDEVFAGSTVEGEVGIGVKVYRNKEKTGYYYFLMATVDSHTEYSKQPSENKFLLINDLCFSFGQADFLSQLAIHSVPGDVESDGRAKGATFVLDDSAKEFYVGLRYYNNVSKKEGCLVYFLKILPSSDRFVFEGYGNGGACFQKKIGE